MAKPRTLLKIIIIALITSSLFLFPITTEASFSKLISGTVKQQIIKGQKKEQKDRDKKNAKYLRIRGKVYRGQKLTKAEQEFWNDCIKRLEDKQFIKRKEENNKNLIKNAPTWKKIGSKLFGQWVYKLEEQPEWQDGFYSEPPMINDDIENLELPGMSNGVIIAPSPLPFTL